MSGKEVACPRCGTVMSLLRERTEVIVDGMRISVSDYWCPNDGLWHYNPDTNEFTSKEEPS